MTVSELIHHLEVYTRENPARANKCPIFTGHDGTILVIDENNEEIMDKVVKVQNFSTYLVEVLEATSKDL